jgi:hypothetical protein
MNPLDEPMKLHPVLRPETPRSRQAPMLVLAAVAGLVLAPAVRAGATPQEGPSLEATLKFVVDKVTQYGTVSYAIHVHDDSLGQDMVVKETGALWVIPFGVQTSNIAADPGSCKITWHETDTGAGKTTTDGDNEIALGDVVNLEVLSMDQHMKRVNSKGPINWSYHSDPPVFVVLLNRSNSSFKSFNFYDEQLANRVAKALVHAVELCSGPSKEPF